jgi:hypothetical protein
MIRFPRLNIATSTVNRILNVHDEIMRGRQQPSAIKSPADDPAPADPNLEGTMLNAQLMTPPQPSDAPDNQTANAIALKAGGLL